jgi:hypothetical protein
MGDDNGKPKVWRLSRVIMNQAMRAITWALVATSLVELGTPMILGPTIAGTRYAKSEIMQTMEFCVQHPILMTLAPILLACTKLDIEERMETRATAAQTELEYSVQKYPGTDPTFKTAAWESSMTP